MSGERVVKVLDCNAADLHADAHVWDFGGVEHFVCFGTPGGHIPAEPDAGDVEALPTCCNGEDSSKCCPVPAPPAKATYRCTCSPYFGCSEYEPDCPQHGIAARRAVRGSR